MKKHKEPTAVSLVDEALRRADDFMTTLQVREATKLCSSRVYAALSHLKQHRAANAIACDDALYWYATPTTDDRCRLVHERVPEAKPRAPRKAKAVKP